VTTAEVEEVEEVAGIGVEAGVWNAAAEELQEQLQADLQEEETGGAIETGIGRETVGAATLVAIVEIATGTAAADLHLRSGEEETEAEEALVGWTGGPTGTTQDTSLKSVQSKREQ
jgi:hypothetical protein